VNPQVRRAAVAWRRATRYRVQGRYAEADTEFRRAYRQTVSAFGPRAAAVGVVLNDWAVLCKYDGRFAPAARMYRRAFSLIVAARGCAHPDVATILHNLAGLEHARGRFGRGLPFARKGLALRTRILGPNHPEVAADGAALAAIFQGLKRYAEAERLYRRVLVVFRRVHGLEHYDIAVTLNNLGALCQSRGRLTAASRYYRRALAMKTKLLSANHIDVAITLNNLATLQNRRGQTKAAKASYARALEIFTRSLSPGHPRLVRCQANYERLAACGREQGCTLRVQQGAHRSRSRARLARVAREQGRGRSAAPTISYPARSEGALLASASPAMRALRSSEATGTLLAGEDCEPYCVGGLLVLRGSFSGQFAEYHAKTAATAACWIRSSRCTRSTKSMLE
jgi:tetratricopeptide (TPR) repeat protein